MKKPELIKKWFANIHMNENLGYGGARTLSDIEKEYDSLIAERQQLIEALVDSKKAIESMPNDVLGIAELSQGIVWYVRDDVLDQIKTALRDAGTL